MCNARSQILLVQEKRNKKYESAKGLWGLPTGKIKWNESIIQGLDREMKEELNVHVRLTGLIGIYQYLRKSSQCLGLAFQAEIVRGEEIVLNSKELYGFKWWDFGSISKNNLKLRKGTKEVIDDFFKKNIVPIDHIHIFDLR